MEIKVTCNVRIIVENSVKYHNSIQFCKEKISFLGEECDYKVQSNLHIKGTQGNLKMYPL